MMTVRERESIWPNFWGEVSSDLISRVTDAVLDEVRQWQNHTLTRSIRWCFRRPAVKIRDEDWSKNKAVWRAGAPCDSEKVSWPSVDRTDRERQILAQGDPRTEDPGVNGILIAGSAG
jgi:hypothetical protein